MAKLPTVHIAQPCPEAWDRMAAEGPQRRRCDRCQEAVHDLSAMTADEVASFAARGPVCVRVPTSWTAAFQAAAALGAGLLAGCDEPAPSAEPVRLAAAATPTPPPVPHHEPIPDAGTMDRPSQWNLHSRHTSGRMTTIQVIKGTQDGDVRKGAPKP